MAAAILAFRKFFQRRTDVSVSPLIVTDTSSAAGQVVDAVPLVNDLFPV
jgi:hypothetical protein